MFKRLGNLSALISNLFLSGSYELSYIVDGSNWVILQEGVSIAKQLNKHHLLKTRISASPYGVMSRIVHFGYEGIALGQARSRIRPDQKRVATWFHVAPENKGNRFLVDRQNDFDLIHTSCLRTRNILIGMGIQQKKICIIPLGVDTSLFIPANDKDLIRDELNIPLDAVVIGSFQKDGVGWGTGDQPKLIKGPDILVDVIKKLAAHYPVHVLLVGPARGYVVNNLRASGVKFTYVGYLKNYCDIARYYRALDFYLITSRIEGGPKAILEAWASGIPVVSTRVGMVPDISTDGETALLADVEDTETLCHQAARVIDDEHLRKRLIENGNNVVQQYSWDKTARQYYDRMYSRLLQPDR
jgi:glycosyltransferase involved in cell wall biosynthesis